MTPTPRHYAHNTAMLESIKRVRTVYPANHKFATAGAEGNYTQYGKYLESK